MAAGATVTYARSAKQLAEDFEAVQPTVIISVPRVFERVSTRINERMSKQPLAKRVFLKELVKAGSWPMARMCRRVIWRTPSYWTTCFCRRDSAR